METSKLSYDGNILTYPNWNGYVTCEPVQIYREALLWSGNTTAANQKLNLSQHPSAFDTLKILTYGANAGNNTIEPVPIYADYKQLSSFNMLYIGNNFWGATASNGVTNSWWFAGMLTGTSGQQWTWTSAYGRNWNVTSYGSRYDFTNVREIWGIDYGV